MPDINITSLEPSVITQVQSDLLVASQRLNNLLTVEVMVGTNDESLRRYIAQIQVVIFQMNALVPYSNNTHITSDP